MSAGETRARRTAERLRTIPSRHGRLVVALLCVILALGFGLRLGHALSPIDNPGVDAQAYFQLSKDLYEDGTYGSPTMKNATDWSPGAPLLYAGVYFATGGVHDGAARVFVSLLGVLSIIVVYLLARRMAGPWAGLLAALLVAIYPPFVHNNGRLLSEPPVVLTLPAAVLAFLWATDRARETEGRGPPWIWIPAGLLFGVTALIRPEFLVFGAVFAVLALLFVHRHSGWRPGWVAAVVLVAAFALPIVPWTIRNYVELNRLVPITTGGGKALYVGTNLPADGDYVNTKSRLATQYLGIHASRARLALVDPVPLFDRVAARYPNLPRDEAFTKLGWENFRHYFGDHPLAYTEMLARKAWRMWRFGSTTSMQGTVGIVLQRLLLALAVGALATLAWRRRNLELLVYGSMLLGITAIGSFVLATPRRNETVMALVCVLAASAVVWLANWIRGRAAPEPEHA